MFYDGPFWRFDMQQLHGEKVHVKKAVADVSVKRAGNGAKRRSAASAPMDREEKIRQTAYALYEARGFVSGFELEDWLTAEAQVGQAADKVEPTSH
jgi:hypothetical protein